MESEALIERISQVTPGIQRLTLAVTPALHHLEAGQQLLARVGDGWEPYLREAWFPLYFDDDRLVVERHAGTHYSPGQRANLIGPVGEPFPWVGGANKHLLLIAYDAAPTPLLMLAELALAQGAEVAMILIGRAQRYPTQGIPAAVELIHGTDDGTWPDLDDTLRWADQAFMVADSALWLDYYSAVFQTLKVSMTHVPANFIYCVSSMPLLCGVGACLVCMVRCKTALKLACTQGLALDLTEIHLL